MSKLLEAAQEQLEELLELGKRNASLDETRLKKIRQLVDELLALPPETVSEPGAKPPVKEALREAGLPAKCYAYVPDPAKPATWKLPYRNADGSVDATHLGAAAAAFSSGGFRGQKVSIPAADVAAVKKKLAAAYREIGKKDTEIPKQLLEAELVGEGDTERVELSRITPLAESEFIAEDGTVKVQIIKAGWGNKRDNHYYPASTLERDHKIFEGLKMYCDHPTALEEKQRPERSLRDWVGTVKETWVDNGIVWGKTKVHAGWFKDLIREAAEEVGISINALGDVRKGEMGGRVGGIVEALVQGKSVDFVTQAGAGGRVAALYESARKEDETMFETMTDEEILAALKESKREGVTKVMKDQLREEVKDEVKKEVEKELKEAGDPPDDITALKEANEKSAEEIEELRRDLNVRTTREAVAEALGDSKLPPISQEKIKEAFTDRAFDKDEERTSAIEEAIKSEREYVGKLTESGRVRGLGDTQPDAGHEKRLKEAYQASGLTEEQAEIAARGR